MSARIPCKEYCPKSASRGKRGYGVRVNMEAVARMWQEKEVWEGRTCSCGVEGRERGESSNRNNQWYDMLTLGSWVTTRRTTF